MDPALREAVVPKLRELDTPEHRRAFWVEILSRFPQVANDLLYGKSRARPIWLTVTDAAKLLLDVVSDLTLEKAKARVSRAASRKQFKTNNKNGSARRIDRDSFSSWLLDQREKHLASSNPSH